MPYRYINHLTALKQASLTKPSNTAFKVPFKDGWKDISYQQFWNDVQHIGAYWFTALAERGAKEKDVIGLWTFGKTYTDIVHIFGLQRAGYAPHLVSPYWDDIDVVQPLFKESGVRIIIRDTRPMEGWERLEKEGVQVIPMLTDKQISEITITHGTELNKLPSIDGDGDDILSIEQSSGTISGRPKIVQHTRRWMDATAQKCQTDERRPIFIRSGSFCYSPQLHHSLRTFIYADCTVLTPQILWSPEELSNIITTCGVTDIVLYPSLIENIIEKAKTSSLLLEKLKTLKTLSYGGGPLGERAIEWAKEVGIKLICIFGSTETALLMASEPGGDPHILSFYRKFDYTFVPIQLAQDPSKPLYELVILPTSPDYPSLSMRDPKNGYYHTKDLFEPVGDGTYISRGRIDDIIVTEATGNCDAKYLQERISYLCHDLISTFVVLGQGRPTPALLVEPLEPNTDIIALRESLSTRIDSLNSSENSLYPHERIKPEHIAIVPKGSLPISQNKKVVIRSKAEVMFKELLDQMYAGDSLWNCGLTE